MEPAGAAKGAATHRWASLLDRLTAFWRAVGITALWLLAALPIATAGAATVAMLAVVRDDALRQQRPVVRSFLSYTRANAVTGTALLVITGGPIAGLILLGRLGTSPVTSALWPVALIGTIAALPVLAHGFPLAAHTHQTVRSLYRASVLMTMARPGATAIALGVIVAVAVAATVWPFTLVVLGYPAARALFSTFRRSFDTLNVAEGAEDEAHGLT